MEPKYKVNPLTGELQEYYFEYNGILALRNFTAKVEDERLILHAADDVNFSILEALVSEVEINGVVYDNPTAAQEALTRLTFNQNRPVLLDKSLKDLILGAVQKIPGKKLSTEDFTTELRNKLEGLQQVDISGLLPKGGYTGTAQDLKNLIDNVNRILQSDDTDLDQLQEIVTYIKQNKHILSTLGINNIAGLVEALAAKADKDHHHDERYAPITHHHNEYALRTHRHNKDDIDGLPANIATTENVKTAIDGIQIGGRNYVLKSKEKQTSVGYIGKYWTLSEPAIVGIQYTFSCYASVEDGRQFVVYFTDIDGQQRQYIITYLVNGYNEFTIIPNYAWTGLCAFHEVSGVSPAPTATIEKLKFEKGNKATDWTPAPEDLIAEKTWEKQQHSLYGESLVTTLPSVQREVVIDNNSNSKNNLWTADNELNVGSRNVGGYAKINCNGYKIQGKDDNFVLTAGGNSIHKNILLGKKGYVSDGGNLNQKEHSNSTIFMRSSGNFELSYLENLTSCSFIKVFDGGNVTFTCDGKTIITRGDTQFNGAKGSTAVVCIYENECYIRISNV